MTHAEFVREFAQAKRAFDDAVTVDAGRIEREAAGLMALELVNRIEPDPGRGGCHPYRDRRGVLHTDLYPILNAMTADVLGVVA